jgi:SAM-dependent methyltransferase
VSAEGLALVRLIEGYRAAQALHVAARLGLADLLRRGPRPVAALARACGADEESLYRLLRALASLRVFTEVGPRRFAQTPLSDRLRRDHPDSLRGFALLHGEAWHWGAWGRLLETVRTGRPADEQTCGPGGREPLAGEAAEIYDQAMAGLTRTLAAHLDVPDLAAGATLVDVGGGQGALLEALLRRHPTAQGVLFDEPAVIARARAARAGADVRGRLELRAGSFFEAVPEGDVLLLKFIVHDWADEPAARILTQCRRALRPGGRVILIEAVLPPGDTPHPGKLTDLEMLVATRGGRERTEREYAALLRAAGLRLEAVVPTLLPLSLIVARPAAGRAPPKPHRPRQGRRATRRTPA